MKHFRLSWGVFFFLSLTGSSEDRRRSSLVSLENERETHISSTIRGVCHGNVSACSCFLCLDPPLPTRKKSKQSTQIQAQSCGGVENAPPFSFPVFLLSLWPGFDLYLTLWIHQHRSIVGRFPSSIRWAKNKWAFALAMMMRLAVRGKENNSKSREKDGKRERKKKRERARLDTKRVDQEHAKHPKGLRGAM